MAEKTLDSLADSVSELSSRFQRLEALVESLVANTPAVGQQCAATAGENIDSAGRRHVTVDEQRQSTQSAVQGSYSELQSEFRAIKESVAKIKLPPDLTVGDSRAGVSRPDLPKFNLLQKSARFQETVLKLLSTYETSDPAIADITTVTVAHLRFLQEEYTHLLVSSQFDEGTSKLFSTLQQNPAAFPPNALENLHRAVSIAGARPARQVSWPASSHGRWFPSPPGAGRGGRGFRSGQFSRPRFGTPPADAALARGRPDLPGSRDVAGGQRWGGERDVPE